MASDPFKNLIVRRKDGEALFQEGDLGSEMYVVQSGMVRLFRLRDGMKQELAVMEKGDFFGELAVLEGLARTTHAEAIGDVEVIEINSATFDRMIRANIEIAVRMLRKLSNRLQEANSRLEGMTQTGATARADAPPAAVDLDLPAPPPPPEPEPEPEPVARKAPAAPTASAVPLPAGGSETRIPEGALGILILEGGGKIFTLRDPSAVIGRYDPVTGTRPEIDLTQYDINRSVSRRHARLAMQDGSYHLIEEVGALNGTLVNGRRLTPGKPQALVSGDRIALGMVKLVFQAAGPK
ncbi:MAG TPA: cyclic nucleotide-binding domain-containing protein [Dongiaceae bacterium]|nr:cyclic nucleotide-binding domain-containing protein [Dongiaceae bacterium]